MTDKTPHVYVILGNAQWDFADCQTALSRVSAQMIALPSFDVEDELIAKTRDAASCQNRHPAGMAPDHAATPCGTRSVRQTAIGGWASPSASFNVLAISEYEFMRPN